MKRQTTSDELFMLLADGEISKDQESLLLELSDARTVEDYLSIIDLEDELSRIDSSLPCNFQEQIFSSISERTEENRVLKAALTSSFKNTFLGLLSLLLVIGPDTILNGMSAYSVGPTQMIVASSFQVNSIVEGVQVEALASKEGNKDEVAVLIELVDGATKQKEFVSGILRVNKSSPSKASLVLPRYEASVLKEYEKRVAL